MQLRDYMRMLVKRAWIIGVAIVIAATSAFVVSEIQTPIYRSTLYLNLWPARLDWGLQQTLKGIMRNYAGNMTSRITATKVIDRTQIDITPEELIAKLTVRPIEEDYIIQVDADDPDPILAQQIAQETAEVFLQDIAVYMADQDKQDQIKVSIRDYAQPGRLHRPNKKINTLAGAIFGGLVGVLVIFVLEWLEADILRTVGDVERHTGLATLGVIPTITAKTTRRA